MPLLRVQNICKSFGPVRALQGVNLEVENGETIAVIGPSGCGKTTLLRCLGLFDEIDAGELHFDGKPVITVEQGCDPVVHVDPNHYHTRVGMVFQHLNIWPHLSVLSNLTLSPMKVRRMGKREAIDRAKGLLEKMGVQDKTDAYPQTLSGGQLQRVAIARALMMNPDLLLLDEITSALDPELVSDVLDIIANLASNGMTMVIVTHEMQFAFEVADRVLFLDNGEQIALGPPASLFGAPTCDRLRIFLRRVARHRKESI